MKDYNLQIIINTILKNSWIISLNKNIENTQKVTKSFSERISDLSSQFVSMSTSAWIIKDKLWWLFWNAISEAENLRNSMVWLKSIVEWTGWDFDRATKIVQDFTSDWLVWTEEAAKSLKNLLSRGFGLEEAKQIMDRFKDSAAFWRQAWLSLWDAIAWATEWLKNENSVLVDNAWVTKNVAKMWEDYAKKIWVSTKNLTMEQKREAELQWILEETKFQVWDAVKLTKEYSGQKAKLNATIKTFSATIWSMLLPVLSGLIWYVTPILEWIKNMATEFPTVSKVIVILAWAFTGFLIAVTSISAVLPLFSSSLTILNSAIGILWKSLIFLVTNPIWLIITAIWALVVAWVLLYQNWETVKNLAVSFWEKILELYENYKFLFIAFQPLIDLWIALYRNWDLIKEWASVLWTFLVKVWEWIKNFFVETFTFLSSIFTPFFENIQAWFILAFNWLVPILSWIFEIIKTVFSTFFNVIFEIWSAFYSLFTWDWEGFLNSILNIWKTILEGLKTIFSIVWEAIKSVTIFIWGLIKNTLKIVWDSIYSVAETLWNDFKNTLSWIWNWIYESATNIFTNIKESIISLFKWAIEFVEWAWKNIKSIWNDIKSLGSSIWEKASSAWSWVMEKAWNLANSVAWAFWRAYWWNVSNWKPYFVWERWRELFIPETNWKIIPNNQLWWNNFSISISWNYIWNEADEERLAKKVIEKLNYQLQMSHFGIS